MTLALKRASKADQPGEDQLKFTQDRLNGLRKGSHPLYPMLPRLAFLRRKPRCLPGPASELTPNPLLRVRKWIDCSAQDRRRHPRQLPNPCLRRGSTYHTHPSIPLPIHLSPLFSVPISIPSFVRKSITFSFSSPLFGSLFNS